jgi:hypothetical protein
MTIVEADATLEAVTMLDAASAADQATPSSPKSPKPPKVVYEPSLMKLTSFTGVDLTVYHTVEDIP